MVSKRFVVEGTNVDGKKIYLRMPYHHIRQQYDPLYDDDADYNTNAKSYYDYLSRFNKHIRAITDMVNRAMRRNIEVEDTNSIDLTKIGDWIDNGNCGNHDDVIKLKADLILSKQKLKYNLNLLKEREYDLKNAIKILNDGVYAPDYDDVLKDVASEINNLKSEIDKIKKDIESIKEEIRKIIERIEKIETMIKDLNKKLDALSGGGEYTILKMGTDYNLTFYNNFYTPDKYLQVGIIDLSDRSIIRVQNGISSLNNVTNSYGLKHDNIQTEFKLRHSDKTNDSPLSRIFKVEFLGKYSYLNDAPIVEQTAGGLWNMRPVESRASYEIGGRFDNYNGEPLTFVGISYIDGYNTQFDVYKEKLTLTSGNIVSRLTILKPSPKEEDK